MLHIVDDIEINVIIILNYLDLKANLHVQWLDIAKYYDMRLLK